LDKGILYTFTILVRRVYMNVICAFTRFSLTGQEAIAVWP